MLAGEPPQTVDRGYGQARIRTLDCSAKGSVSDRCLHSGRRGRLIGTLGYILAVLGRGTAPRGEKMAAGSRGTDSRDLATILDPFRAIFADLGPDRLSAI